MFKYVFKFNYKYDYLIDYLLVECESKLVKWILYKTTR